MIKSIMPTLCLTACCVAPLSMATEAAPAAAQATCTAALDPALQSLNYTMVSESLKQAAKLVEETNTIGDTTETIIYASTLASLIQSPDVMSSIPAKVKAYLEAILPLQQEAAAEMARIKANDFRAVQQITEALKAKQEALNKQYPKAAQLYSKLATPVASVLKELKLDAMISKFFADHSKTDPKDAGKLWAQLFRELATIIDQANSKLKK